MVIAILTQVDLFKIYSRSTESWYTYPSEKYDFVSWDDEIPNIRRNKKSSKPPTRQWLVTALSGFFLFMTLGYNYG